MSYKIRWPYSVTDELDEAAAVCARALEDPRFHVLPGRWRDAPQSPSDWFELLSGYPDKIESVQTIKRLILEASPAAAETGSTVEQYAVLQALSASVSRIRTERVPNSVKQLFATSCGEIATPTRSWRTHFHEDMTRFDTREFSEDGKRFRDLARLSTLRRFPAGDCVFDFYPFMPRHWFLKVAPMAAPGLLYKVLVETGGWGPHISPHLNSGRPNQLQMNKHEWEQSIWRLAKTMELRPEIRALVTDSWLISKETGEQFPNLAWVRAFFVNAGAYLIDMEPAANDSGLRDGSARRKQLHEHGKFCPRNTFVIWPRADVMTWASSHNELTDPGEEPIAPPSRTFPAFVKVGSPAPRPPTRHNSRFHVWNGLEALHFRTGGYVLKVLVAPSIIATVAAAMAFGWWAAAPALAATLTLMWFVQYYFFQ